MNYRGIFFEVVRSMKNNLMRTILTMTGIIIGIGAVVAIMSAADSVTTTVGSEMEKTGLNKITIGHNYNGGPVKKLDDSTINFLKSLSIVGVKGYEGNISLNAQARNPQTGKTVQIFLNGVVNVGGSDFEIIAGRGIITEEEILSGSQVIIINQTLVKEFFYGEYQSAVNQLIKINGATFKIIGVFKENFSRASSLGIVPVKTLMNSPFNSYGYDVIKVIMDSSGDSEGIREQLLAVLLKEGGFDKEEKANFSVSSPHREFETFKKFMTAASAIIAFIAAISLIVGGVGIMNIMLITVTERTKEIGLMRSLGAKKKDIVRQFLTESIIITVFGGILGIGLGILVAFSTIKIINMFDNMPDFMFSISILSMGISLAVSILIGLCFGAYPAIRASKLNPVEALRRE